MESPMLLRTMSIPEFITSVNSGIGTCLLLSICFIFVDLLPPPRIGNKPPPPSLVPSLMAYIAEALIGPDQVLKKGFS